MRVLYIIPAAFEYFDDIKKSAFSLLEKVNEFADVEVDAITLQYGNTTSSDRESVQTAAPSRRYDGLRSISDVLQNLGDYDVVHLHTPFLGAAHGMVAAQSLHSHQKWVITHYRSVKNIDLIAFGIKCYNYYYLPKIFKQAKVVTAFPGAVEEAHKLARRVGKAEELLVLPEDFQEIKDWSETAASFINIYLQ